MSFRPMCLSVSNVLKPLSKPPARPRSSSFFWLSPSMEIRIPMFGNFLARAITLSSNQPEVEITIRGVCLKHSSTISSRSSRINGSPPVRLMNFSCGSVLRSEALISSFLSVGFCQILHIWQRIGQRYVRMMLASVGRGMFVFAIFYYTLYISINLS